MEEAIIIGTNEYGVIIRMDEYEEPKILDIEDVTRDCKEGGCCTGIGGKVSIT